MKVSMRGETDKCPKTQRVCTFRKNFSLRSPVLVGPRKQANLYYPPCQGRTRKSSHSALPGGTGKLSNSAQEGRTRKSLISPLSRKNRQSFTILPVRGDTEIFNILPPGGTGKLSNSALAGGNGQIFTLCPARGRTGKAFTTRVKTVNLRKPYGRKTLGTFYSSVSPFNSGGFAFKISESLNLSKPYGCNGFEGFSLFILLVGTDVENRKNFLRMSPTGEG